MTQNSRNKKMIAAIAFFCLLCMLSASIINGAVIKTSASGGNATPNSGLIYIDHTIYAINSNRVLSEVFSSDQFTLTVQYRIPEDTSIVGGVSVQMTGGGFTTAGNNIVIDEDLNLVTISFDLVYTGSRSTTLSFSLFGNKSINGGEVTSFDGDARSVTISECRPDSEGAEYIPPSGVTEPPRFAVDLSARFSAAKAGQKYILEIPVKNVGKQAARDITISIDPGDSGASDFPFEYDKYAFTARMGELTVNSVKNARFELNVLPTAKNGQHSIKVNFAGRSVLGVGSQAESSETIIITVNNTNTEPKLTLERIDLSVDAEISVGASAADEYAIIEPAARATTRIEALKPGSRFYLTLNIQNSGTLAAKDIAITLKGLKADGISTDNSPEVRFINQIAGLSGDSQTFTLICAEGMSGDRTELSMALAYADETGKTYTGESQIFIPLVQTKKSSSYSSFELTDITAPSGELGEGSNFSISFNILNTGDVPMEDIKLTYNAGSEFIGKSLNTRMLKPIPPGAGVPIKFDFSVSRNFTSGNFPIAFTVEYTPGSNESENGSPGGASGDPAPGGQRISSSQYVGILLNKPEETTTTTTTTVSERDSVPKIIISNYEYTPKEAKAGQTVDISLTFFNTSMSQDVKNIKIQMDSDTETSSGYSSSSSGVFTPIEGSNSFYIEQIAPREEVERSIKLMIKGDADAKSYQLYANIEYEDSKSNPVSAKESISIPVSQVTKVTINDVMITSPYISQNQPFSISYTFINMGKTTLYNVMASVEGPFSMPAQGWYAGNLSPGSQDYYDTSITPEFGGEQTGYALITYEDAQGNLFEERLEFPFYAAEAMDMGNGGMFNGGDFGNMGMIDEFPDYDSDEGFMRYANMALERLRDPKIAAAAVVGLLIIIIVIVSLVRREKHKRLERELNRIAENELSADMPNARDIPETRDIPDAPDAFDATGAFDAPDTFDEPDAFDEPDTFDAPDAADYITLEKGVAKLMAALEERMSDRDNDR